MEQINLSSNGKEIQKAYEKVVRDDPEFTWVIYGPDSSKAYTVSETGTDFDEFLASFDESQIQFGLARITPPGSDVKKNLLVGWCPDSAPLKPRSSFAQNFAEVSKLLKGYHVQITARDSDDLDRDELLSRLSAAAGARYSIQATRSNTTQSTSSFKPTPVAKPTPVSKPKPVAAPKPLEPQVIKPKPFVKASKPVEEEDEWNEPELEERDFTKKPLTPNVSAYKPIGKVNLQEVIKAENAKIDPRLEIEELRKKDRLQKDQELDAFLKTKPADFTAKAPTPASTFGSKSDKLVGGISKSFGAENGKTPAQLWAEKKLKQQGGSAPAVEVSTTEAEGIDDEHEESVSNLKSKFEQLHTEEVEEEEEEKHQVPRKAFPPPSARQQVQEPEPEEEEEASEPEQVPEPEEEEEEEEEVPEPEEEEETEKQYTAIAEYDYDASEGNELSFKEGDKITILDFIDDDWWLGETESGDKGLFPSNYVTLEE